MSEDNDTVDWREAFKGDLATTPEGAIALRGLRYRERLTQAQLARYIGVLCTYIDAMENGRVVINEDMATRLSKIFNVDYRMFLG